MVRATKAEAVGDLSAVAVLLEGLAIANKIVFIYDGDEVAGKGEALVIDPAAEAPISVSKDGIVRVHVVPTES